MINQKSFPRLVFPETFSQRDEWEMTRKGFVYASVEVKEGVLYPLFFIDPVRLQQDIMATLKAGHPCYSEPGIIVIPEVTVAEINKAIPMLIKDGFFNYFTPKLDTRD